MSRRALLLAVSLGGAALFAAGTVLAQSLTLDLGGPSAGSSTARIVQILALMTVLTLAPSIMVMVTSFTRIVIVLSLLRTALGTQSSPPNVVMMSLALFLTGFVMAPTFTEAYNNGISPLIEEQITEAEAFEATSRPFHSFMMSHVRQQDLDLFMGMAKATPEQAGANTPFHVLIPAFMISELRRAFEIGFLLYLPFLVIDMVIASVLMSMGMMMLPPVLISLPFKILLFVMVDGWYLLMRALVLSFN